MRNDVRGIALIASLLVLVAVMALGSGSLFLSNANLGLAGSQRANLLARNGAEVGMEVAYGALRAYHEANGSFPAALTITGSPSSNIDYTLVTYTPYTVAGRVTQAMVQVRGAAGGSATFLSEAMFTIVPDTTITRFRPGLISENVVSVDGNIQNLVNAQIHGNAGYVLDDSRTNYRDCDEDGFCVSLARDQWPVSASPGATTCSVTDKYPGFCDAGIPAADRMTAPAAVGTPPYDATRLEVFGSVGSSAATNPACDVVVSRPSGIGTYPAGTTVCVSGGGTMDRKNLSGITVIVYGNLTIKGNTSLTNANVLTTGTLLQEGNTNLTSSRLFSEGWLWIKGNVYSNGPSTIATGSAQTSTTDRDKNALRIEGNIRHTDPNQDVGLLMMSKGGTWVKGNFERGGASMLHGLVWSGGPVTVEGNINLRGGVNAVGRLTVDGNVWIDGRANLTNADLPSSEGVQVASWR